MTDVPQAMHEDSLQEYPPSPAPPAAAASAPPHNSNHRGGIPHAAMELGGSSLFLSSSKDMAAFFETLHSSPS